jgi:sugar/nucleoside kinase (ribokinase family)
VPPAGPVVDQTGAGDAFTAAWLAARRAGAAPEAALRAACALAARVVTRPGARP